MVDDLLICVISSSPYAHAVENITGTGMQKSRVGRPTHDPVSSLPEREAARRVAYPGHVTGGEVIEANQREAIGYVSSSEGDRDDSIELSSQPVRDRARELPAGRGQGPINTGGRTSLSHRHRCGRGRRHALDSATWAGLDDEEG
ncbi:hypothetical protein J6590_068878 [Homalodisca vitripennis]|nr:hypothetical protein J6590_068878 [Homalodisca vitripennis]